MPYVKKLGFTLVELLIVIAIIGVLVAVIFVALDPATRLAQARDAVRQNDVGEILSAIKLYQVDHGGQSLDTIANLSQLDVYMAVDGGGMNEGCDDNNVSCTTPVTHDTHCVNIHELIQEGYLADMPVSPSGEVIWDVGDNTGDNGSGYTISLDTEGIVTVRACENEATSVEIQASR
ncbi:type II secretion system protein [Candidatus Uhrbacteria bacterium]|nr:type II secretion system protein [Candidatus Uhrbacteria bacterium]